MRFESILRLLSHNHAQKATLSHRVYCVGDKRGTLPLWIQHQYPAYIEIPGHLHAILQIVGAPLAGAQNAACLNIPDDVRNRRLHMNWATATVAPAGKTTGDKVGV